jgi:hypothetical protein
MHHVFRSSILKSVVLVCLGGVGCHSDSVSVVRDGAPDVENEASDTTVSVGEFSFFAVSLKFIKSKAPCSGTDGKTCLGGLGGDLRNGKSNGIDGADSLCREAARLANPGDRHVWRAFLSAGNYQGAVLHAIDRIGVGPWYSAPPKAQNLSNYVSEGLLVAKDKAGLSKVRPDGDTTTIVYTGVNQSMGAGNAQSWPFSQCLLNEYGYCTQADGDTHDTLTGTKSDGTYAGDAASTCDDWTNSTKGYGKPVYGHTWPRQLNATDNAAQWIDIGENLNACGAIINVTSTNYGSGSSAPGTVAMIDGGAGPGGMVPGFPDGGAIPAGGPGGSIPDGMGPGMSDDAGSGGMGSGGITPGGMGPSFVDGGVMPPWLSDDGGMIPLGEGIPPSMDGGTAGGENMGLGATTGGATDSTYAGGVGSSGGYGAFYCFAYVTGSE